MWRAIEELKAKNIIYLELGDQHPDSSSEQISQKEKNISDYKRGFGGDTFVALKLQINL